MARYLGDIHADVADSAETIAARINELYQAMQLVESCGAHPLLTDAVNLLGKRLSDLRTIAPQYIHYDNWPTSSEEGGGDGA